MVPDPFLNEEGSNFVDDAPQDAAFVDPTFGAGSRDIRADLFEPESGFPLLTFDGAATSFSSSFKSASDGIIIRTGP